MVTGETSSSVWIEGEPIQLWKTRYGGEWTFSYHNTAKPDEVFYHWHSSLASYPTENQAREAMRNFVQGLNARMRKA